MNQRTIGIILAIAQVSLCLALIWVGEGGLKKWPWLWTGVAAGGLVTVSGVWGMRNSRVKITPEPAAEANLCDGGVYAYIRHPMYSGLLLAFSMFAIGADGWLGWALWAALLAVLVAKLQIEETLWSARDTAYRDYMTRTKRLVPWIW